MRLPRLLRLKWRFQFSLRTLLIAVAVFAVCLGYVSDSARRQKKAVAHVRELGGTVGYKSRAHFVKMFPVVPGGPGFSVPLELWDAEGVRGWLSTWIDPDWVDNVATVRLPGQAVPDSLFVEIEALTDLEYLNLSYTQCDVQNLRVLAKCRRLKYLFLGGTGVRDSDLAFVTRSPVLEELDLTETRIGDSGLNALSGLSHLRALCLDRTHITNNGLAALKTCAGLELLTLCETRVDDGAVQYLQTMKQLRVLELRMTSVTPSGVNRIRAALPKCQVCYGEDPSLPSF